MCCGGRLEEGLGAETMTLLKKMRLLQRKGGEMEPKKVMEKTRKYLASVGDAVADLAKAKGRNSARNIQRSRERLWEVCLGNQGRDRRAGLASVNRHAMPRPAGHCVCYGAQDCEKLTISISTAYARAPCLSPRQRALLLLLLLLLQQQRRMCCRLTHCHVATYCVLSNM